MQPFETLREILDRLRQTYCGSIGVEYMHIQDPEQKQWLQDRMEATMNLWPLDESTARLRILNRLIQAEEFEHFLHNRFRGPKALRVSKVANHYRCARRGPGPGRQRECSRSSYRDGASRPAERAGQCFGKSMVQVFSEFEGEPDPDSVQGSGDVKYHLGASGIHRSTQGKEILVSVAFNPSHLEAVDPVVEGLVRPKQDRLGDTERKRVIPI